MDKENETQRDEFILLGFSYLPQTKIALFVILLIVYLVNLSANSLFIIVTLEDSRLHSPMYFFLCNLSLLDISYASISCPTVLQGLLVHTITITFYKCIAQMYIHVSVGQTECLLLAVMAWDRYVAICKPLSYHQIMNLRVCVNLAIITLAGGFVLSLSSFIIIAVVHFCGNIIDHTMCEAEALSHLTCMDVHSSLIITAILSSISLVAPVILILATYCRIIAAILRMPTTESRHRTFATCSSHLACVTLFYGAGMAVYMGPTSSNPSEVNKSISLFYDIVVPAINPFIYTLRNNVVKSALCKLCKRHFLRQISTS